MVDADPDQLDAPLRELGLDLLVDRELVGADRAEVEGVEDEQDLPAPEVGERDLFAVLVAQGEVGGRLPAAIIDAGRARRPGRGSARGRCARGSAACGGACRPASAGRGASGGLWRASRRCSVSSLIRSVSSATWTSAEPVSPSARPYLPISSLFFSLVRLICRQKAAHSGHGRWKLAQTALARPRRRSVHLGDQLLDPGEALLAAQALDEGDPQRRCRRGPPRGRSGRSRSGPRGRSRRSAGRRR